MRKGWKVEQGVFDKFYWRITTPKGTYVVRGAYNKEEALKIVEGEYDKCVESI